MKLSPAASQAFNPTLLVNISPTRAKSFLWMTVPFLKITCSGGRIGKSKSLYSEISKAACSFFSFSFSFHVTHTLHLSMAWLIPGFYYRDNAQIHWVPKRVVTLLYDL